MMNPQYPGATYYQQPQPQQGYQQPQLQQRGYQQPQQQQFSAPPQPPYSFPAESSLASIPDPTCPPYPQQQQQQPQYAQPSSASTPPQQQSYGGHTNAPNYHPSRPMPQHGRSPAPPQTTPQPSQHPPMTHPRPQHPNSIPSQSMGAQPASAQQLPPHQSAAPPMMSQQRPPVHPSAQQPAASPPQQQNAPPMKVFRGQPSQPTSGPIQPPMQSDRRTSAHTSSQYPQQYPAPPQRQQSTAPTNQSTTNGCHLPPSSSSAAQHASTMPQSQKWKPGAPSSSTASTAAPSYSTNIPAASQHPQHGQSSPPLHPSYPAMNGTSQQTPDARFSSTPNGIYYPQQSQQPQQQPQSPLNEEDFPEASRPTPPPQVKVETLTKNTNSRIDPAFVPRPVLPTDPISQPGGKRFETDKYTIPPPPFGVYTIIDRGSASCRFLRVSLNQLPTVAQTLKSTGVPLAVVASPFPIQGEYEDPIPTLNLNKGSTVVSDESETEGPPRCSRCHSYISPFMTFPDELTATCNFCGHTFMLPKHYQYALSEYTRIRHSEYSDNTLNDPALVPFDRSEIIHGAVDWAAPNAFLQITGISGPARAATKSAFYPGELCLPAPAFCFAIDTSASAQQSGLTMAAFGSIKYALNSITNPATKVCIVTFDQTIKFYPLSKRDCGNSQSQQQIFVVTDITDPFFPAHSNALFTNATETKSELEALLDDLPKLLQADLPPTTAGAPPVTRTQSCGNAALRACVQLLSSRGGGAVKMFYGNSPDIGVGAVQRMNLASATNKDQISHPLHPVPNLSTFYSELVADCINSGVVVDGFIAAQTNRHIGISTLGYASRRTGGYCNYYGNFDLNKGYQRLCMDLSRQLQIPQGYDCIFKIRCSRGFTVSKIMTAASLGIRDPRTEFAEASQFRIPRIDADQSLMFELKHEGEVPEESRAAYIQYAVLHTTMSGVRRIRVATLAVAVTNSLSTTFRYSEVETVLAYFVRKTANALMTTPGSKWRDEVIKELVEILFSYRLNCAATTSAGQLILPDALKSLPVYISGLFKNAAFRSATDLYSDEKDFLLSRLLHMPLHQLIISIYPRLYVLHRSYSQFKGEKLQRIGTETGVEGEVYLPPIVASSGEKITTDGFYLLDNGLTFMLYVGIDVDPVILNEVFGTTDLNEQFVQAFNCEELKGTLGGNINRAINQIRKVKSLAHPSQPIVLVRPRSLEESLFTWHLIEDKLGSEPSYVDFLCQLHKSVYHKMEDA